MRLYIRLGCNSISNSQFAIHSCEHFEFEILNSKIEINIEFQRLFRNFVMFFLQIFFKLYD